MFLLPDCFQSAENVLEPFHSAQRVIPVLGHFLQGVIGIVMNRVSVKVFTLLWLYKAVREIGGEGGIGLGGRAFQAVLAHGFQFVQGFIIFLHGHQVGCLDSVQHSHTSVEIIQIVSIYDVIDCKNIVQQRQLFHPGFPPVGNIKADDSVAHAGAECGRKAVNIVLLIGQVPLVFRRKEAGPRCQDIPFLPPSGRQPGESPLGRQPTAPK